MASFLEDVGRAQPFQTFTQGVSKIRSDIQAREINDQTRRINEIKIQETQKQIARDNRVITNAQFMDSLGDTPQIFKDSVVETAKRRGFMDANGDMTGASQANMLKFINTAQGQIDTLGAFSKTAVRLNQDLADIDNQISTGVTTIQSDEGEDTEKKLSPKDIKQLQLDRKTIVQQESKFKNGIKSLGGIVDETTKVSKDELIRLQGIRNTLKPDDPRLSEINDRIDRITAPPASLVTINQGKPASPRERSDLAEAQASIDALDDLEDLFDDSFVGPLEGRKGSVFDLFGGNTQRQSEFIAATFAFKNQIIKEITGAQMSELEAKRILKQVPDVNNPSTVWKAKLKQSRKNLSRLQRRRREILRKSGITSPDFDTNAEASGLSDAELKEQLGIE